MLPPSLFRNLKTLQFDGIGWNIIIGFPHPRVWECTQTTTTMKQAWVVLCQIQATKASIFSHKTVSHCITLLERQHFFEWDASSRMVEHTYYIYMLFQSFLNSKTRVFPLSQEVEKPAAITLAALENTAANPVMPTSPLRNLAMRRRKNL